MKRFDYSFLSKNVITARLLNLSTTIYTMRERASLRKNEYIKIFTELEKVAKIESVKNSNAIEGIVTSAERINSIVKANEKPKNHSEKEIAGYRDALKFIHENYEELEITEKTILKIYELLTSYVSIGKEANYKKDDTLIIEVNENGERTIRFTPTKAKDVKEVMKQLIIAYKEAKNNPEINELLLIPCFVLDFVSVHPFSDGNGRISRLLSLLLLYKSGFDVGKYISFETQINNYKDMYYDALKESSIGWNENKNNYIPFIEYYLFVLYKCYKELDSRFITINNKKVNKSSRIEATVLNSVLPISKADICNMMPDISPTTVEKVIGEMVKLCKVKKIGSGRNTKYYKEDE